MACHVTFKNLKSSHIKTICFCLLHRTRPNVTSDEKKHRRSVIANNFIKAIHVKIHAVILKQNSATNNIKPSAFFYILSRVAFRNRSWRKLQYYLKWDCKNQCLVIEKYFKLFYTFSKRLNLIMFFKIYHFNSILSAKMLNLINVSQTIYLRRMFSRYITIIIFFQQKC